MLCQTTLLSILRKVRELTLLASQPQLYCQPSASYSACPWAPPSSVGRMDVWDNDGLHVWICLNSLKKTQSDNEDRVTESRQPKKVKHLWDRNATESNLPHSQKPQVALKTECSSCKFITCPIILYISIHWQRMYAILRYILAELGRFCMALPCPKSSTKIKTPKLLPWTYISSISLTPESCKLFSDDSPFSEQTKGFSPVWSRWWVLSCPLCTKAFPQSG